jgi:DNA-binding winged helix-turn-helix (wHTH) protein
MGVPLLTALKSCTSIKVGSSTVLRPALPNPYLFRILRVTLSRRSRGYAMVYRFSAFELDEERRELRLHGREVVLQRLVFDLLAYLVRNRERVVSKDELLDALWPDAIVADGALQRAMSLLRSALEQGGGRSLIRTYSRHGYRFCAEVATASIPPSPPAVSTFLERARLAYEQCEWEEAIRAFEEADREGGLAPPDLERWAHAAQCGGREPAAIGPLERAAAAHAMAGDRRGAARAALLLAQIQSERREIAVAKGWHNRAASLLAGEEECGEHGLLEWLGSRLAAIDGDLEAAVRRAERAVACGRRLSDPDLEALGLLYLGVALLATGDVRGGTALQDEAGAAALAGAVSPWVGGTVYCGIIWGCRNRSDWSRAAQWTEQFERWCERTRLSGFPGLCRLHRAEVLTICGELTEAEQEVREACELLAASAPWAEGDAHRVLGEIRMARGDLAGAEAAFRRAYELGWDPQPGYALLHLARGRPASAVRALERGLEAPGWVSGQRRGLLLAHLAVAAAAAGQEDSARAALKELEDQPDLCSTPALAAVVARAQAELALCQGSSAAAISSLRQELRIWQEIGAPVKAAQVRLRLAQLMAAGDDPEAAELELCAAAAAFRKVGAPEALRSCEQMRSSLGGLMD